MVRSIFLKLFGEHDRNQGFSAVILGPQSRTGYRECGSSHLSRIAARWYHCGVQVLPGLRPSAAGEDGAVWAKGGTEIQAPVGFRVVYRGDVDVGIWKSLSWRFCQKLFWRVKAVHFFPPLLSKQEGLLNSLYVNWPGRCWKFLWSFFWPFWSPFIHLSADICEASGKVCARLRHGRTGVRLQRWDQQIQQRWIFPPKN